MNGIGVLPIWDWVIARSCLRFPLAIALFVLYTLRGPMHNFMPKALVIIAFFFTLGIITFISGQILTLSEFAATLHPVLGTIVFGLGASLFGLAVLWLMFRYLSRPKALELGENPSDDEVRCYATKLVSRLKSSPHMAAYRERQATEGAADRAEGERRGDEIESILGYLDDVAMTETRRTASRIFLATAISRNGRLDTIIVLALLVRLVWRVSHIYNQRPHPRQMLRLYVNVAGTALAAGALEDIGLEEHIHALLTPMLAASPVSSVPTMSGVGTMLGSALVDGSANALLALRVGIVTRNVLSPTLPQMQARPNPYSEAATILGKMSRGLVSKVVKTVMQTIGNGVKNSACSVAKSAYTSTKNAAQGVVHGVTNTFCGTGLVATGVAQDGLKAATKISNDTMTAAANMSQNVTNSVADAVTDTMANTVGMTEQFAYADDVPPPTRSRIRLPKFSFLRKK